MPEREDPRPIKVEVRNLTKRFGDLLVLDDLGAQRGSDASGQRRA